MRTWLLLVLVLTSSNSNADPSVCTEAQNFVERKWSSSPIKEDVKWVSGNYSYINPYIDKSVKETNIVFAHIDIDNNGQNDTVIRGFGGISGSYGHTLVVAKDRMLDLSSGFSYDGNKTYDFGREDLYMINSYPPWPYQETGVYLASMIPIVFEQKMYLILADTLKRGYVVADYSDSEVKDNKDNIYRLLLNPICSRKYDPDDSSYVDYKSLEEGIINAMSIENGWGEPMSNVISRYNPNEYVPALIKISISHKSPELRVRAAYWLSSFYTSNGAVGYLNTEPLENEIDNLLLALDNPDTLRFILNILGNRYTGQNVAPCYMSQINQEKILFAIREKRKHISAAPDKYYKQSKMKPSIPKINEWNHARGEMRLAIQQIEGCKHPR